MTPRQRKALQALLHQPTKEDAAFAADIDPSTLRRYLQQPEFRAAYDAACRELLEDAARQLKAGTESAIALARTLVEDKHEAAGTRLAAAKAVLDYSLKFDEIIDLERRLRALEERGIQ